MSGLVDDRARSTERLSLRVNGDDHDLVVALHKTLLEVLREDLGLTGTKHGCELGECGACTVRIDGEPVLSCLVLPVEVEGREIETVEGLAADGRPHELQVAFTELGAAQCGYCTSGIMMSAKALLDDVSEPSREQIKEHLAGNLCRCTGYLQIIEAVELAARRTGRRDRTGGTLPPHDAEPTSSLDLRGAPPSSSPEETEPT